jgi:TM2 domain-containing membrane protein YozV
MSGVSQINYWRESKKPNSTDKVNVSEGGPGATYLSYDVFLGLSVIGGLFGLDHLYLRSPLTFIAKIIVNILTFGSWWVYDASQAFFNKDVVKVFGLGVPGFGPKGIGAGVLASDVPDKKHMAFFIYALALFFGGVFGLDSFIVGDKQSGFIRLICLITAIFAPIAIFWWLFNVVKFFFKTQDVTSQHWEYFGAPSPADHGLSWGEMLTNKFSFLQYIFGPIKRAKNDVIAAAEAVAEAPVEVATMAIDKVASEAKPLVNAALAPVSTVVQPLANTVTTGLETVKEGLTLGEDIVSLAGKTVNVAGETAQAATEALKIVPNAAALSNSFTPATAEAALNGLKQEGGANSGILPYMVIGTFGLIAVSGLFMTYRRSKKNEQAERNDTPPEPGVL